MCSCHRCPEACHHPNADLHPQPPHPTPSAEGLLNDDDLTPSARLSRMRVGSRRVPWGATQGHVAPRSGSAPSAAGASRACSLPPAEAGHCVARRTRGGRRGGAHGAGWSPTHRGPQGSAPTGTLCGLHVHSPRRVVRRERPAGTAHPMPAGPVRGLCARAARRCRACGGFTKDRGVPQASRRPQPLPLLLKKPQLGCEASQLKTMCS